MVGFSRTNFTFLDLRVENIGFQCIYNRNWKTQTVIKPFTLFFKYYRKLVQNPSRCSLISFYFIFRPSFFSSVGIPAFILFKVFETEKV